MAAVGATAMSTDAVAPATADLRTLPAAVVDRERTVSRTAAADAVIAELIADTRIEARPRPAAIPAVGSCVV